MVETGRDTGQDGDLSEAMAAEHRAGTEPHDTREVAWGRGAGGLEEEERGRSYGLGGRESKKIKC